jgi:excisionase family DNA binding protein
VVIDVPRMNNDERLMTPREVAAKFRVHSKTVGRWDLEGRISCVRTPGGHRRFRESEVRRLLGERYPQRPPRPSEAERGEVSTGGSARARHQRVLRFVRAAVKDRIHFGDYAYEAVEGAVAELDQIVRGNDPGNAERAAEATRFLATLWMPRDRVNALGVRRAS